MSGKNKQKQQRSQWEETSSGWGCPHELAGECKLRQKQCVPGVPGCVLHQYMNKPEPE